MSGDNTVKLTDKNFKEEVLDFSGVVLVDFWASWCGPCQVLTPIVETVADELKGNKEVKIGSLSVDDNPETTEKYQISAIPSLRYFIGGEVVAESVGVVSKEEILQKISAAKTG